MLGHRSRRGGGRGAAPEKKKRAWQLELERGSESPPPAERRSSSAADVDNERPPKQGEIGGDRDADRSARDVFGGAAGAQTAEPGERCIVFLDIAIGGRGGQPGEATGRIEIELFMQDCPRTAENFRQLCLGSAGLGAKTGLPLTYVDCPLHRIIPGFMAQGKHLLDCVLGHFLQDACKENETASICYARSIRVFGGDFQRGDGTGGESIYGGDFADENLAAHRHTTRGMLSMANSGRHTNGSQFFLTFARTPHLDGKHCVFGRVVGGFPTLDAIEAVGSKSGDPKKQVVITGCGEVADERGGRRDRGGSREGRGRSRSRSPRRRDERRHR
eukprot:jgi/Tetstr1/465488/TSEL_000873.t1